MDINDMTRSAFTPHALQNTNQTTINQMDEVEGQCHSYFLNKQDTAQHKRYDGTRQRMIPFPQEGTKYDKY